MMLGVVGGKEKVQTSTANRQHPGDKKGVKEQRNSANVQPVYYSDQLHIIVIIKNLLLLLPTLHHKIPGWMRTI